MTFAKIYNVTDEAYIVGHFCSMLIDFASPKKENCLQSDAESLARRFTRSCVSNSIIIGGFEPLDYFDWIIDFIKNLRELGDNSIVVVKTSYERMFPKSAYDAVVKLEELHNVEVLHPVVNHKTNKKHWVRVL